MTFEQKEKAILNLLYELPLFQRVRIAIQIMQGIQPEQITVGHRIEDSSIEIGEKATEDLKNRISDYEKNPSKAKDAFESLSVIRKDLLSK